jgi:adenylate cyclase
VRRAAPTPFWAEPLLRVLRELSAPPPTPRVLAAMRDVEWDSEALIAWLQLVAVAAFFVALATTLPAFNVGRNIGPVPAALALYGLVVCCRLRLIYKRALGPALRRVFDFGDVAILMTLIWAFTLQYDASPALYLKGPTLFYAFGLIALRALRFEALDVALTGLFVAAGWIILVLIAARSAPVAQDYPQYMTSLSIFWGAEAEKIFAILGVAGILTLRVARGRALLARLTAEEAAAREFSRLVGPEAARRARGAEVLRAGDGDLRPTGVLFLDLRGFSAFSARMSGSQVIAFLNEYQQQFVPLIAAHGGVVDKFLGDGILATFCDPENGCEAAAVIASVPPLLAAWDVWAKSRGDRGLATPPLAAAITHGDVVHGLIGHGERLEFTVIGEAVNLAAKLEKHAKVEKARAIATLHAFALAKEQGLPTEPARIVYGAEVEGAVATLDLAILA